jgi:hypothetical protein
MTLTTTTPTGKQRTAHVSKMRDAGQIIAYTLADNTGIARKEATRLAMHAEKTGTLTTHGYTFTIEQEETR